MAKAKSSNDSKKLTFGVRKRGKAQKLRNKHDHSSKVYRGQGR